MIKYINRILYALVAAIGVLFVYNLTMANVKTKYLTEQGEIALNAGNYEYFISTRFYDGTPLYNEMLTSGDKTYLVRIYEVAYVKLINEQYMVTDGLFFIMHQQTGDLIDGYFDVTFNTESDLEVEYLGFRVLSFPLYSALDQDTASNMIPRYLFVENTVFQNITGVTLSLGEETLLDIVLSIEESEFNVKSELENYILTNDDVPTGAFSNVSYAPIIMIDANSEVTRNIIIYILAISLFTFGLFTYKKKRLGRKEPTIGVQKDIEKLKDQEHAKR